MNATLLHGTNRYWPDADTAHPDDDGFRRFAVRSLVRTVAGLRHATAHQQAEAERCALRHLDSGTSAARALQLATRNHLPPHRRSNAITPTDNR